MQIRIRDSLLILTLVASLLAVARVESENRQSADALDKSTNLADPLNICKVPKWDLCFRRRDAALVVLMIDEQLFEEKRKQQAAAVKKLLGIQDGKKRMRLVGDLMAKVKQVLVECETHLTAAGSAAVDVEVLRNSVVGPSSLEDSSVELRDTVSKLVENVAFACQFILYFPDYCGRLFRKDDHLSRVFRWAYELSGRLSLHGESARELMELAGQELMIIPRREDYRNPYGLAARREEIERAAAEEVRAAQEKRKAEQKYGKAKRARGPGLSEPSNREL